MALPSVTSELAAGAVPVSGNMITDQPAVSNAVRRSADLVRDVLGAIIEFSENKLIK